MSIASNTFPLEFPFGNISTDTEFYVWEEDYRTVVSFRGTTSFTDWIYNFRVSKSEPVRLDVNAHEGYVLKWKSVYESVHELVTRLDKPVALYGFSQGGAVAVLTHLALKVDCPRLQVDTCVLGCPPVFYHEDTLRARELCGTTLKQIEYGNDVVPSLGSPRFVHGGYRIHIGPRRRGWLLDTVLALWHRHHCDALYEEAVDSMPCWDIRIYGLENL